jgi:hypothetical protein
MLPSIGTMIAFYIVFRCLEYLNQKTTRGIPTVFSIITIIVTGFCWIDLILAGTRI